MFICFTAVQVYQFLPFSCLASDLRCLNMKCTLKSFIYMHHKHTFTSPLFSFFTDIPHLQFLNHVQCAKSHLLIVLAWRPPASKVKLGDIWSPSPCVLHVFLCPLCISRLPHEYVLRDLRHCYENKNKKTATSFLMNDNCVHLCLFANTLKCEHHGTTGSVNMAA